MSSRSLLEPVTSRLYHADDDYSDSESLGSEEFADNHGCPPSDCEGPQHVVR